jgi:von Willebrand factor type A domain
MNISYHLDYETIVHGRSELVHLAILFRAAKQAPRRSSSFAFGLVLDTSGSMNGQPLEQAKAAAQMVITHLGAEDRISVVTFSDAARTIIPLQAAANKEHLKALIAGIESEGMTNLTAGWMQGRDEVAKAPGEMPRKVHRLVAERGRDALEAYGSVRPDRLAPLLGTKYHCHLTGRLRDPITGSPFAMDKDHDLRRPKVRNPMKSCPSHQSAAEQGSGEV